MENNNTQTPPPIPPAPIKYYPQPKKKKSNTKKMILLIILGVIVLGGINFLPLGLAKMTEKARARACQAMSRTNLQFLGSTLETYRRSNDDKLPPNIETLYEQGYLDPYLKTVSNPSAPDSARVVDGKLTNLGYVIFFDEPEIPNQNGQSIRAYEKIKFSYEGKISILYTNGRTDIIAIAKLNSLLKAQGRPPAE